MSTVILSSNDKPHSIEKSPRRSPRRRFSFELVLIATVALALVGWSISARILGSDRRELDSFVNRAAPKALRNGAVSSSNTNALMHKKFAYIFYVTGNSYACAALQFIDRLVNKLDMNTSRIDVVVMHTKHVGSHLIRKMQDHLHVRAILVESIHAKANERTWRKSLTKLRAFQDWGYDRVVYLDSDAVPMANLDHLFDLPPAPLYAPTAYWLDQPFFTSTLLVIEPGTEGITEWANDRGAAAGFDMDILNAYFADSVRYLPAIYTVLNSDFRRAPNAKGSLFNTTTELKEHVQVVHFSCKPDGTYGKPWGWPSHDLSDVESAGFDPLFGELFREYWRGEEELCGGVEQW